VLKAAKISFRQGTAAIDCTVRDISDGGARLLVASAVGEFVRPLVIDHGDGLASQGLVLF
jgi:hypothetical protein